MKLQPAPAPIARTSGNICRTLVCVVTAFAAMSLLRAQTHTDAGAPQTLQLAPSAQLQEGNGIRPDAQPADSGGLRITPGSRGTAQPQTPPQQPAAAPSGPSADEIVRALTGVEGLQPPRDITRTGYWQANGYWLIPALAVLLLAAAALGYYLYRRGKRPVVLSPQLLALQRISEAQHQSDDKRFASSVSNAVRNYLEARFGLRAPEQTTEEFLLEERHGSRLPAAAVAPLTHLLELCDLAKFARQGLSAEQRTDLSTTAQQLVFSLEAAQNTPVATQPAANTNATTQPAVGADAASRKP